MNTFVTHALFAATLAMAPAYAGNADDAKLANDPAADPIQVELAHVKAAREAVAAGDEDVAVAKLDAKAHFRLTGSSGAVLARRAAMLCECLLTDNNRAAAIRMARRVCLRLKRLQAAANADGVEQLYWEAWLYAEVLDQKLVASELLVAAAKIAPADERVFELQNRLAGALAEFGR